MTNCRQYCFGLLGLIIYTYIYFFFTYIYVFVCVCVYISMYSCKA